MCTYDERERRPREHTQHTHGVREHVLGLARALSLSHSPGLHIRGLSGPLSRSPCMYVCVVAAAAAAGPDALTRPSDEGE